MIGLKLIELFNMTKFIIFIGLLFINFSLLAESFEGSITFRKITNSDTTYYTYFVKDNLVRVDEHTKSKKLLNSLLVNLFALTPVTRILSRVSVNDPYR